MRTVSKSIIVAAAAFPLSAMASDSVQMASGRWREVFRFTAMTVAGQPIPVDSLQPPEPTRLSCVGPKEAADPRLYFATIEPGDDCEAPEGTVEGGRISLRTQCKLQRDAPISVTLEGTYGREAYHLTGNGQGIVKGKPLLLNYG